MKVTLIGIDLAKTIFQVCGVNQAGKPVFNRTIRRAGLLSFVSRPVCSRQGGTRPTVMMLWRFVRRPVVLSCGVLCLGVLSRPTGCWRTGWVSRP